MDSKTDKPATASDVRRMVGDVDDVVVSRIVATEATAAEVLQALQWFRAGGEFGDKTGHEPHGSIRAVYEILQAEEPQEP